MNSTLYAVEEQVEALLNALDLAEGEDAKALQTELAATLDQARDKRDHVFAWIRNQMLSCMVIDQEIDRLEALKEQRAKSIQRIEEYVIGCILTKGPDKKGRFPKLEGNTSSFSVQKNPPSVEITEDTLIPALYSSYTLHFNPEDWADLMDRCWSEPILMEIVLKHVKDRTPSKTAIKAALGAGKEVPGAQMAPTKYRLEME